MLGKRITRKFEDRVYTISGLYSLRNKLREQLILVEPLEELFICPSARNYEADGLLKHIEKLRAELVGAKQTDI